ncbi:MAG: gliding motility protein GldN [Bacteroidales bacterium]|nr:gliding motility protein GldN [Bacteroidales bacterium]
MRSIVAIFLGLTFMVAAQNAAKAQDLKKEVYDKIHIPNKKPIPYPYTREADVMWSKIVWRTIDLRQKMNLNLYYPLQTIGNRMNLVNLLLWGMDYEGLKVYDPYDENNEFKMETTKEEVDKRLGVRMDTILVEDPDNPGQMVKKISKITRNDLIQNVKQINIKEKWFFDKNYSTLQVRIIGICPVSITPRLDEQGNPTGDYRTIPLFWVYYPDARNLLASHEVFNRHNDAQNVSFDDLFMQRRFDSYIYRETNVYNNRLISSYARGVDALYESERIKNFIFNFEHDLWEY